MRDFARRVDIILGYVTGLENEREGRELFESFDANSSKVLTELQQRIDLMISHINLRLMLYNY